MDTRRLFRFFLLFVLIGSLGVSIFYVTPVEAAITVDAVSQPGGDIEISWGSVSGAATYDIYRSSTNSQPGTASKTVTAPTTSVTFTIPDDGLVSGQTWYFWVEAYDNTDTLIDSTTTPGTAICDAEGPQTPSLSSPADGSYVIVNPPTLTWSSVQDEPQDEDNTGIDSYTLQYSTSSTFTPSNTTTVSDISSTSYTFTFSLANNTYYWRVKAVDNAGNEGNWSSARSFTINLQSPTLLSPTNGASFNSDDIPLTFSWSEVTGAYGYLLEIDDQQPISSSPVYSQVVSGESTTSFEVPVSFTDDTYYWRVSAVDNEDNTTGVYSSVRSFSVDSTPPGTPSLSSPANNATIGDTSPTFSWQSVSDAESYKIEIATASDLDVDGSFVGANVVYTYPTSGQLTSTTHSIGTDLDDGEEYYWHVMAFDAAGNEGDWSSTRSFEIDTSLPTAPTLNSPSNGATIDDTTPTFSWGVVTSGCTYTLRYSTSSTCPANSTTTEISEITGTSYTIPSGSELSEGTYYWQVKASTSDTWSDIWSFTVDLPAQQVDFQVRVLAGATGSAIDNATVSLVQGPNTIDTEQTNSSGNATLSSDTGTYTLQVTKSNWDSGNGTAFSRTLQVTANMDTVQVLLYTEGRDLIVARVKYNDNFSSTPESIVIYRNDSTYQTVTLPRVPPGIMPQNLRTAQTNLVIEVPTSGTYSIASSEYTSQRVSVTNLSQSLADAYNNVITLDITSSISGVVVDDADEIITGASVMLIRSDDESVIGAKETSAIGFTFDNILPGSYYLRIQKDGYGDVTTDPVEVGANEDRNIGMIPLTQPKGTLNIVVRTTDGQPVEDVTVTIFDNQDNEVFSQMAAQGIVGTELPGGTYTISASAEGYVLEGAVTTTVTAGETTSETVRMIVDETPPETGSIQISLADNEGNPIQLVEVFIDGEKVGVTNQDGILLIEDLEPKTYQITLKKEGFKEVTVSQDATAGETNTVSKTMTVKETADTSSRLKWILGAIALIILFAIILYAYTHRQKGSEEEEEEYGTAAPVQGGSGEGGERKVSPRVPRQGESRKPERGGIPQSSTSKEQGFGKTGGSKGGLPSQRRLEGD
ncbi:MAG TPA: PEGA domain-containing protein [Methanomicrobia archaeon]|nr:PEGA domain-containing protein [Methanomicrobia archaeon]